MDRLLALQDSLREGARSGLTVLQSEGWTAASVLMAMAFGFGLIHALLPGHGKLLLTSYHAGHGRSREALVSSIVVIATHVLSAIVIVLAGFSILKRTIGGAGRAPQLEFASNLLIVAIGLWLLWRATKAHHHTVPSHSGFGLAFIAGLVPCPLTAFTMSYAVMQGVVGAGLVLCGFFALGMIVTVALFPLAAVALRGSGARFLSGERLVKATRVVETVAALAIIILGLRPLIR
jgi:nickel/cobalt transporter (NicO) family protein